jgi:ParB family chromosome partitioning protein
MTAKDSRPRLGRGLAALLGDGPDTPPPAGVTSIAIDQLEPSPFQPRGEIDPEALTDLVASVRARGILQPLLARPAPDSPDRYQIIAGERRWRAAQAANLHSVPVLVRTLTDAEAMSAALVENLQRQDLNAVEEAEGYRRLLDEFGMTQDVLAEAVGKSRSHVTNTLRLLNLPRTVQAELKKGALTAGHARALLAHPEPEKAALQVIARGLNVRQTEALANARDQRRSPGQESGGTRAKDPETVALERDLSERLGLKIEITFDGKGGLVRIHYRSLEQLDGIITLLNPG